MCDMLDFKVNDKPKWTLFNLLEHQLNKVGPNEDEVMNVALLGLFCCSAYFHCALSQRARLMF